MMKRPRQKNDAHLRFIRELPCLVCLNNIETEAAHIRMGNPRRGKRPTGMGEKPNDIYAIPLCGAHHREQHSMGEDRFWSKRSIDAISTAQALWCSTGDHEAGEQIIRYLHE